ncbi:hypothetical protein OIO89_00785 (plasmid) [Mycobacterium ulcerans]|uniref:hypothetical protein n=1 Tax=Mycobacterium marinum TaxID=1781 RepID=UPI0015E84E6F|nr:hypothetical protein [Mycobacterium marinum]UZK92669.1 hypothetical protein OIO89_00785 [Mycobacterium ulcerans]
MSGGSVGGALGSPLTSAFFCSTELFGRLGRLGLPTSAISFAVITLVFKGLLGGGSVGRAFGG